MSRAPGVTSWNYTPMPGLMAKAGALVSGAPDLPDGRGISGNTRSATDTPALAVVMANDLPASGL